MTKFLFEYSSQNKNASMRLKPFFKIIFMIIIIAIIIYSFTKVSFQINFIGYKDFVSGLQKMFEFANNDPSFPSNTVFTNSLNYLWITIKVTLAGTTIGFLMSVITSFLASRNITNSFLSTLCKILILFLRSFPAVIFINIAKDAFDNELAAICIFAWFSWIWCHKYLLEIIANIDAQGYHWFVNKGYGRVYTFKKQILVRCKNKFIMIFLYSLESNFRWTTILATVGVIGIGFFIDLNIPKKLEFVGIPLAIILISILFLEMFSVFVNKFLLNIKSKNQQTFPWKSLIKFLLLAIAIAIIIYTFSTLQFQKINLKIFKSKLSSLAYPQLSFWTSNQVLHNPWLQIIELFYQCIVAITIASIYAIIMSLFISEKIQKIFIWLPFKLINNILKVMPVVILFHVFNPVFVNAIGLGVILFGIHSGTIIAKQLSESINNLETEIIKFYQLQGYSKIMIIKIYIWPTIKKDFKSFAYIRLEIIFRGMIILGSLGLSIIGNILDRSEIRKLVHHSAAYIWPILITIFIYNLLPIIFNEIRKKLYEKNYKNIHITNLYKTKSQNNNFWT